MLRQTNQGESQLRYDCLHANVVDELRTTLEELDALPRGSDTSNAYTRACSLMELISVSRRIAHGSNVFAGCEHRSR